MKSHRSLRNTVNVYLRIRLNIRTFSLLPICLVVSLEIDNNVYISLLGTESFIHPSWLLLCFPVFHLLYIGSLLKHGIYLCCEVFVSSNFELNSQTQERDRRHTDRLTARQVDLLSWLTAPCSGWETHSAEQKRKIINLHTITNR